MNPAPSCLLKVTFAILWAITCELCELVELLHHWWSGFTSTQSITQDSWNILISLLKPPLTSNTLRWWSWGEVRNALQWLNREFFCFPAWNIPVLKVILQTDVTLAGLELGLLTMKKGEFSRFLLQPQYAYGEMGCPPFIPTAAVVLYEVQILDYLDSGQVDDFITMSLVGRLQVLCLVLPTSDRSASLLHILKSLYFFAFIAQIRNGLWFLFSSSGAAEHRSYVHTSWSCQHTAELWQPFLQPEPILQCQRSL